MMSRSVRLLFSLDVYREIQRHLFAGDGKEHAGVLLCGWYMREGRTVLTTSRFLPARDGVDYTVSPQFHGRLGPLFIEDALSQAKQQGLAYVAIHNHFSDSAVAFSPVDMASHEYGYPTLALLNSGLPVGAAVFGTESVEVDLWMPGGVRLQLETARVLGRSIRHLWASPSFAPKASYDEHVDRQLPFLRAGGQGIVAQATVGIVGVGGLGSQLIEPLVRLGIRRFVLLDPDRIDVSNYSRVHGAIPKDLPRRRRLGALKINIAKRLIHAIAPDADVQKYPLDVARGDAYEKLLGCDFVFLAADTAEARLTSNALAHQYFIPMAQVGSKVHIDSTGCLQGVFGAVRNVRPGRGCLWCNGLIDRVALADAGKTQEQRNAEKYGTRTQNPAVVTFNAEVAAHALNEFLRYYAAHWTSSETPAYYTLLDLLTGERELVEPTRSDNCPFCSSSMPNSYFGVSVARRVVTLS
jgi:molybdopterin/thiamine biosynthesis adenylyltransferase